MQMSSEMECEAKKVEKILNIYIYLRQNYSGYYYHGVLMVTRTKTKLYLSKTKGKIIYDEFELKNISK